MTRLRRSWIWPGGALVAATWLAVWPASAACDQQHLPPVNHQTLICADGELARQWRAVTDHLNLAQEQGLAVPDQAAWLAALADSPTGDRAYLARRLIRRSGFLTALPVLNQLQGDLRLALPADWSGWRLNRDPRRPQRLIDLYRDQAGQLVALTGRGEGRTPTDIALRHVVSGASLLTPEQAQLFYRGGSARLTLAAQLGLVPLPPPANQLRLGRAGLSYQGARHGGSHCATPLQFSLALAQDHERLTGVYAVEPLGRIETFRSQAWRCAIPVRGNAVVADYQSLEPVIHGRLVDGSLLVSYDNRYLVRFRPDLTSDFFSKSNGLIDLRLDHLGVMEEDYGHLATASDLFYDRAAALIRARLLRDSHPILP